MCSGVHSWINGHRLANGSLCRGYGSFYTQDPQVKHVVVILIWLMLYLCLFGPPHGCYPLDLRVSRCPLRHVGFYVEHVGLPGCVGYVLGIMLGWGVVGVWMGSLPTGLCGPCCFTGEWLLDVAVEIPST